MAPPQTLLFNTVPIHPSDPLYPLLTCAKFCENCKTSETSYWRTDDEGRDHCNPCGLHWTKHRTPRPIHHIAHDTGGSGKLMNYACQICPTRKHARKREEYHGVILCNACADYWKRNNAVRPLIAFAKRPKPGHTSSSSAIGAALDTSSGASVPRTRKCANCGTGRSSRWMPGPAGEENCSECGLFWMYHNMRRPLGVGVGIDVIGPKRESRGPKIMETKKRRRLGSVNTGSGSDEELEGDENNEGEEVGGPRTRGAERREMEEKMGRMNGNGGQAMKVDTPEPPDNTPISLVSLAVLARKVQLQLHELELLNSSLLRRPTIQALVTVIEPLITELSPLSEKDLTSFTRSSISHGVLHNLLAHVTVAEADAFSSESERRKIVEGDIDFGPDNVGDNFFDGPLQNDDIVAAKGLIDLFKSPYTDSSSQATTTTEEDVESAFRECRAKIMALLAEENTESPKDVLSDVIEVSLVDGETSPKINVSGFFSMTMRGEIMAIASEYEFPVTFDMDQMGDDGFTPRDFNLGVSV